MSSIRTLLVQLDATPSAAARLHSALALATQHRALLTGVFAASPPAAALAATVSDRPAALLLRADRAAYEDAHALFESARGGSTAEMRWRAPGPDGALADVCEEAAYADLLVLGAHDPALAQGTPSGLVDEVLRTSGRPALVMPPGAVPSPPSQVVLVGWDASAAAARALAAAQPLLQEARRVLVLDGTPSGRDDGRIRDYLQRHGIAAQIVPWPHAAQAPGEALLALARRDGVDLLVMGCHGHGRLHELLFGSTTCSVLQRPPLPLLLAH
ncbi:universal stress protein [Aquabacterium humicola]|uniref:universal stress protein n=1 Tax=Aquabacterium humicola TaxID=3237377 RepID=UPI002543BC5D|nr:universal stress protein [Rubrivivax pictus]